MRKTATRVDHGGKNLLYHGCLFLGLDNDYWLRRLGTPVPFVKGAAPVARCAHGRR